MRYLGQGLSGAETFCGIMDMLLLASKTAYNKIVQTILKASNVSAENSTRSAVLLELKLTENVENRNNITVYSYGTCKTHCHSSLICVSTVVAAEWRGTEVLSTHWKECETWTGIHKSILYEKWLKDHDKHVRRITVGLQGMKKVVGMNRIFDDLS